MVYRFLVFFTLIKKGLPGRGPSASHTQGVLTLCVYPTGIIFYARCSTHTEYVKLYHTVCVQHKLHTVYTLRLSCRLRCMYLCKNTPTKKNCSILFSSVVLKSTIRILGKLPSGNTSGIIKLGWSSTGHTFP